MVGSLRITPAHAGKTYIVYPSRSTSQDHPRACGENFLSIRSIHLPSGSPPRMRGKLSLFSGIVRITGITPAHAGKTYVEEIVDLDSEDHPRACGENCQNPR